MHKVEEPQVERVMEPSGAETVETHPAYAQIGASRVHGHANLYGSDFTHNDYVVIRIHKSRLNRTLSNDWHHATDEYIEVALSEAQWATFVSSMNVGMGVPCTLQHLHGRAVPQIPEPPRRREQFKTEVRETLDDGLNALKRLRDQIATSGLSAKRRDELTATLDKAVQELTRNVPYVEDQFGEHVERVVEAARVEVNAHLLNVMLRAGLAALMKGEAPPFEAKTLEGTTATNKQ